MKRYQIVILAMLGVSILIAGIAIYNERNLPCEVQSKRFRQNAESLMAMYLRADSREESSFDNSGNYLGRSEAGEEKLRIKNLASKLDVPECAKDSYQSMWRWFTAVDSNRQLGMTRHDTEFIEGLRD